MSEIKEKCTACREFLENSKFYICKCDTYCRTCFLNNYAIYKPGTKRVIFVCLNCSERLPRVRIRLALENTKDPSGK